MVYRAYSLIDKNEIAAQTALLDPVLSQDRKAFVCLDIKCQVPLTLAGQSEEGKMYFTISHRDQPHISDCLVAHADVAKQQGRDPKELLGHTLSPDERAAGLGLRFKLQTKLPVQNHRGPQSNPHVGPRNHSQKTLEHIFYDLSTQTEAYKVGTLTPEMIVPVDFKYEITPSKKISGLKGDMLVKDIFVKIDDTFNGFDYKNEFHNYYGRAFVTGYMQNDLQHFVINFAETSENQDVHLFITVDSKLERLPWYENLQNLANSNRPGWVFVAGHIASRFDEKNNNWYFTVSGQFSSASQFIYVPLWFNDPRADPAN